MAEATHLNYDQVTLPSDHRQLLGSLNGNDLQDSSSDQSDMSDDPSTERTAYDPAPQDDLVGVGVAISRAQTYMKSSQTPAIEKSRVLEEHNDYFAPVVSEEEAKSSPSGGTTPVPESDATASHQAAPESEAPIMEEPFQLSTPWQAHPAPSHRNSLVRSVLGETMGSRRQRSSSGSMLASFKNLLPDLPSMNLLKSTSSPLAAPHRESLVERSHGQEVGDDRLSRELSRDGDGDAIGSPIGRRRSRSTVALQSPLALQSPGLDGNVESLLSPTSPAPPRPRHHRANSDNSLYLSKRPTGLSSFDDTSAFADVTEMNNSRFKAISDTLQNSTLRMPKLPSIKPSHKSQATQSKDRNDEVTRQNTQANTGSSSRGGMSQYTTIRNIRNTKDKQMAEHVQSSQQRAHPVLSDALSRTEGDIVLMGGYRGSVLRDAKPPNRQLWAPVKIGLNLRNVDLEVGLTREDEERAHEKIIPSGTLSHIGPIDICRRLLKHLRKCPNTREGKLRVHDWGYDWRLSPDLTSRKLIKFLEGLECNQPGTPPEKRGAILIAHSLGGLITRHAVNQRPELFAGVVYAGVPQNCVNILGPLRNGDDVLLSSRVLTAQVNFTLRTSFALLPEDGRCFIQKDTNERYDLDFFDLQTWDDHRLSPCISPALPAELRGEQQSHRKSIIGSLSESMSSALPSLPNVGKRGSWFGSSSRDGAPAGTSGSTKEAAQDLAENAANALNLTESPETTAGTGAGESSLEPAMKKNSHKSSVATAVTISPPAAREYLKRTLAEILAFKQALVHNKELQYANKYPPHAFMFGKTVPTVYGARVASRESIKYTDCFDDLAFASGDGVVLASAAQLPEGYRCVKGGRVETDRGHVGLLGDLEGVGKCLGAVVEARKRGVGWGNYERKEKVRAKEKK